MNDKESDDFNKNQESPNLNNKQEVDESNWLFCPVCGTKIPKIQRLKFCIKCGTNLEYLKEHKQLLHKDATNPYIQSGSYHQPITFPIVKQQTKVSDEEITDTKKVKLWSIQASIGFPMLAFLLVSIIGVIISIVAIIFTVDINTLIEYISGNSTAELQQFLNDAMYNSYVIVFMSLAELVFILVPVLYVGRYLKNPTLKNRLGLLGFTFHGMRKKGIIKEILIGLGFAIVGLLSVLGVSLFIEFALESLFGIEIVQDLTRSSDVDMIISSADLVSIIILSIVMILVIGTSEEIVFRGFMQKGLVRNLGEKWGILLTALIFTMIHIFVIFIVVNTLFVMFINFILLFVPYFVISMLLGLVYYWRKENLIAVVIMHGVYDALVIIIAYLAYLFF